MADVVCIGEALIDFVPTETGKGLGDAEAFRKAAGGAPANVAVGVVRLGRTSAFMGMVGDDGFGRFLTSTLSEAGVDVTPLRLTDRARTGLAFVSLQSSGEREFLFYRNPSADMMFAPEDIDEAAIASASIVHFGSITLIAEPSRSGTLRAVDMARARKKLVSYDPNLRLRLWTSADEARAGMKLGLQEANIAKIGEDELEFLTGNADAIKGARSLWHDDLKLMAITRGAQGCYWLTGAAHGAVDGFKVKPVDTTGAGDAFMAGLLVGLLDEPSALEDHELLAKICRFACAVGAITTMERGAIPALPRREEVAMFLENQLKACA
jgi:fructokinase